jgi:antitoxin (DNA-binding transcriptional repressor) of toxin-antitoxin stability system
LRDDTADVLRRVAAGEDIVITFNGRPMARLVPIRAVQAGQPAEVVRRRWMPGAEMVRRLRLIRIQADPSLGEGVDLAGDSTDDLGPMA